jgi:hypothetical protein
MQTTQSYYGPIAAMAAHMKCEWLSYSGLILVLFWSYCCHDGPLEMWCMVSDVLFWSYSGPILVLLLPWRPTGNVMHGEWCPILVLFWSYSGPILVLLLPWRPTGNVMHGEWCPILVLFWSYSGPIAAMTAHWKCDAWWVMSYSGPILVLFWSYCCHGSPLEMWCMMSAVLFWAYSGPILFLLLPWQHTGNVMHGEWCPILVLFCNKQLLLTQSKAFSTINILISHNKHNPKLNNQQLHESITSDPILSFLTNPKFSQQSSASGINDFRPKPKLYQKSIRQLQENNQIDNFKSQSLQTQSKSFSTINNFKSQSITSQILTASGINDFRTKPKLSQQLKAALCSASRVLSSRLTNNKFSIEQIDKQFCFDIIFWNQSFLNNLKQLYAQLLVSFPADWQTINFW